MGLLQGQVKLGSPHRTIEYLMQEYEFQNDKAVLHVKPSICSFLLPSGILAKHV